MSSRSICKWLVCIAVLLQLSSISFGEQDPGENEVLKPLEDPNKYSKDPDHVSQHENEEEANKTTKNHVERKITEAEKIDTFIYNMNFNKDRVLALRDVSDDNVSSVESFMDDRNTFVVITRVQRNINKIHPKIGVSAMNEHLTFPGSILIADKELLENKPTVLTPHRQEMIYHVNLPGRFNSNFKVLPTFATFDSKLKDVISRWLESNPTEVPPVQFSSQSTMVFTEDQLAAELGIEVMGSVLESNIDFNAIKSNEKMVLVMRFTQVYYTVDAQFWQRPSDLFAPDVTLEYLKRFISSSKPPVVVSSVAYGRVIYVKVSTSSKDVEARTILETKITAFASNLKNAANYTDKLKDLQIEVFVTGGSNAQMDLIQARDLAHVDEIILQYKNLARDNLAAPVTYDTIFLTDYSQATIQSTTSYVETRRTEHRQGIIRLVQSGVYIASFEVEWDQVTSNGTSGKPIITRHKWDGNDQYYLLGQKVEIELPGNSNNISVVAWIDYLTSWKKAIDRHHIPLIDKRTFTINGDLVNWDKKIEPALE